MQRVPGEKHLRLQPRTVCGVGAIAEASQGQRLVSAESFWAPSPGSPEHGPGGLRRSFVTQDTLRHQERKAPAPSTEHFPQQSVLTSSPEQRSRMTAHSQV